MKLARQFGSLAQALAVAAAAIISACSSARSGTETSPLNFLNDSGHYSIQVSGVLNGYTHIDATPKNRPYGAFPDFIAVIDEPNDAGKHAEWAITGSKYSSDLGPSDGFDLLFLQVNPNLTMPGTYTNNSCPFQNTFVTKCIAVDYNVSRAPGTNPIPNFYGRLNALADDRDTVVVEYVGSRIKLTIVGPWLWTLIPPGGGLEKHDTVFVRASFDAWPIR